MRLTQQPGFNTQHFPNFFRGKIIDVAEVNQQCRLDECGQWLENVDQTHLVLASGKPVLQKKLKDRSSHNKQLSLRGYIEESPTPDFTKTKMYVEVKNAEFIVVLVHA